MAKERGLLQVKQRWEEIQTKEKRESEKQEKLKKVRNKGRQEVLRFLKEEKRYCCY